MKRAVSSSADVQKVLVMSPFWKALGVREHPNGNIVIPHDLQKQIDSFCKARPSLSTVQALAAFAHQLANPQPKPGEITSAQLDALSKAIEAERRKNPFQTDVEIVEDIRRRRSRSWNPWGVTVP